MQAPATLTIGGKYSRSTISPEVSTLPLATLMWGLWGVSGRTLRYRSAGWLKAR